MGRVRNCSPLVALGKRKASEASREEGGAKAPLSFVYRQPVGPHKKRGRSLFSTAAGRRPIQELAMPLWACLETTLRLKPVPARWRRP